MNKKYIEPEVLVIDDNLDFAQSAAELIRSKYGLSCIPLCNKDDVIATIKQNIIKVAVIDQVMPEIKGTELFMEIKQISPYIKAIMLTGEATSADIGKAINNGFSSYLNKQEITKLPDEVFKQYVSYEKKDSSDSIDKLLFTERKLYVFPIISYSIVTIDKTNTHYINEESWKTVTTILASEEQEFEYSIDYEDKITISTEYETKIKADLDICGKGHINALKNTINAELNRKYNTMHSITTKTNKRIKKKWSLYEDPNKINENHILKREIESAPVYNEYRALIKKECRICKNSQLFPITIYKQTNKIQTRQIDHYSDGSKKVTDTGTEKF